MTVYDQIIALLNSHNLSYKTFEHQPVVTSEQAAAIRGTDIRKGAKSLIFMADTKSIMLVLGGDRKVDFKKVKTALNIKDLRMATHQEVFDLTGVEVGGVAPIGSLFDIRCYLDEVFTQNDTMDFNAGDRAKSIEMAVSDFIKVERPTIIEIT